MKNYSVDGNNVVNKKSSAKWILPLVLAGLALIVFMSSYVVVPAGHTGVIVTLGEVSEKVLAEGFHFKTPFIQQIVKVSNKIQVKPIDAEAVSKDLQSVSSKIAVNFKIIPSKSASIYQNIDGGDYQNVILEPAVMESVKSVTAKYTAEELITKRAQIGQEIKETLEDKVNEYGIVIEKFNIVNFEFSNEFNNAIEAKQVAEQNLIKTRTEQEQVIVIAKAEAEKQVIAAEAEAKAVLAKAEAQAQANELLTKSLSDVLVEYQKVQKWNGELPVVTGGNAILDVGKLIN